MLITDYTTYQDVRAALGVTVDELPDSMLGLELYSTGLQIELEDVSPSLEQTYNDIADMDEGDRSPNEQKVYLSARQFASYAVAVQLLPALPLIAVKTVTDGKAGVSRDSAAPFKVVIAECRAKYAQTRASLEAKLLALVGSPATDAVVPPYMSVVSPSTDPVTG